MGEIKKEKAQKMGKVYEYIPIYIYIYLILLIMSKFWNKLSNEVYNMKIFVYNSFRKIKNISQKIAKKNEIINSE